MCPHRKDRAVPRPICQTHSIFSLGFDAYICLECAVRDEIARIACGVPLEPDDQDHRQQSFKRRATDVAKVRERVRATVVKEDDSAQTAWKHIIFPPTSTSAPKSPPFNIFGQHRWTPRQTPNEPPPTDATTPAVEWMRGGSF